MNTINLIANIIKKNKKIRKIVMRSKHDYLTRELSRYNIKIDFYITANKSRINNTDCFSDEILNGNSDKYFLILSPEAKWNKYDDARYISYGFKKWIDYIWFSDENKKIDINEGNQYNDEFGNTFYSLSKASISTNGYCNNITIGKNTFIHNSIKLKGNEHILKIGNNCQFKPLDCILETNSTLIIGDNVKINGLHIYINSYSSVYIGDFTTLETGRLRTGRNQEIIIGKDCMFSWDIVFLAHDGHLIWTTDGECINNTLGQKRTSIILGNHIWVGGETAILPNTKIGDGSICGYRSLVKGNYPNNCIICGSPAKIIKKDIVWSRQNFSADENKDFCKIPKEYIKKTIICQDPKTNSDAKLCSYTGSTLPKIKE